MSDRPGFASDTEAGWPLWRLAHPIRRRWWARVAASAVVLVVIAFLPVPWMVSQDPNPPGMAWSLDGRLQFNGHTIDPPGSWVGLTAGRPPFVVEVIYSWLDDDAEEPRNMKVGSMFNSPAMAEPAAIAIGLIEAGINIDVTTIVEARDPLLADLPARISISTLNGQAISTREQWATSVDGLGEHNEIITADGRALVFSGNSLPYQSIALMQTPTHAHVTLAGWAHFIPESVYRNLRFGRSHGLLLALAAYSDASGEDLAAGRTIAATGVIRGDGTVTAIGGLSAKARAAHRVGVDVLVYPSAQHCEEKAVRDAIGATEMIMIPVATLTEAIEALRRDVAVDDPAVCDV